MSLCDFYNELKGWQTGIGSLLGFIALMVAALWNFHLNRRRDATLRDTEALSVAAALYGEILLLRREAARVARVFAHMHLDGNTKYGTIVELDEHFVELYTPSEPLLYKALASKIGLLSADLIIAITEFHNNLQDIRTSMQFVIDKPGRGFRLSMSSVLRPARDAVKNIEPALRKIERMTSVPQPVEDIDLGHAEEIIESEDCNSRSLSTE